MQQFEALRRSIQVLQVWIPKEGGPHLPESLRLPHLVSMRERVTPMFSPAKLGRWLGWTQAAVVAHGAAKLDDMKALNHELDLGSDDVETLINLANQVVEGLHDANANHGGLVNTKLLTVANALQLHLSKFK